MREISRDPLDLVGADHRRAPPIPGRAACSSSARCSRRPRTAASRGQGFTHKLGDLVTISTASLGALVNRVNHTSKVRPWDFGLAALMRNLKARGRL